MNRIFTLIGFTCLLAGCADYAPAPSDGNSAPAFAALAATSSIKVPIAIGVFVPCAVGGAGEIVVLRGDLHLLNHFTFDAAGGLHVKTHAQPQGITGVGSVSGDKYVGTGVTQ